MHSIRAEMSIETTENINRFLLIIYSIRINVDSTMLDMMTTDKGTTKRNCVHWYKGKEKRMKLTGRK